MGHTVWQVELDPFCRRVLARHWPEADRNVIDVREAGAHNLAQVDVICGGFPCQDLSAAGKGAGIEAGARSGLWREFARIIADIRPACAVVENVANARGGEWLPAVRRDLHVLGYTSTAYAIGGPDVGCPQRRPRVFVVAYRNGSRFPKLGKSHHHHRDHEARHLSHGRNARHVFPRGPLEWRPTAAAPKPLVGGVAHGIPHRVDRVRALGNAVVPQCAEVIGRVLLAVHR